MFHIGPYEIGNRTLLAPMAGVSDAPFRSICANLGAGMVVSEMLTSDTRLWHHDKSRTRLAWGDIQGPRSMQIVGSDPQQMADAARACVDQGAQIVDINMGCPAKKVCHRAAGSALLRDEPLVARILEAVVAAVSAPVTLKIRTGWDSQHKNALRVAKLAETCGIQALTIHGRTRACRFAGTAEYDTIAEVVQSTRLPVIANGDIDSPQKALQVLQHTGAAAVMIGRAAQGNPWLFEQVNQYLTEGSTSAQPTHAQVQATMLTHLQALYQHYGDETGTRIARKHIGWYCLAQHHILDTTESGHADRWRRQFNTLTNSKEQLQAVQLLRKWPLQLEDQAA